MENGESWVKSMMVKEYIIKHKEKFKWLFLLKMKLMAIQLKFETILRIKKGIASGKKVIYYCGIPAHGNLGDLAQGICIRRWINKHYPQYYVTEIETNAIVNTPYSCINYIKKSFDPEKDFVIFQSGYTTTDLGGYADIMHQAVINALPEARILMMPQTVFFKTEERKKLCSQTYNSHRRMLFLARDTVSYEMAKKMFPDIPKACYPDIVTTLIGTYPENKKREGIVFCLRNDGEKYYSDEELELLIEKCKTIAGINITDTTMNDIDDVVKNAEKYIFSEIDEYSKYKVMVTDRYHGTILSLVAGTPVVIIKTTDHKVTTGADWFKGVYDNHVFVARDLNEAFTIVNKLYSRDSYKTLPQYFEKEYYDTLPRLFEDMVK